MSTDTTFDLNIWSILEDLWYMLWYIYRVWHYSKIGFINQKAMWFSMMVFISVLWYVSVFGIADVVKDNHGWQ